MSIVGEMPGGAASNQVESPIGPDLALEIARLANALFQAPPGGAVSPMNAALPVPAPATGPLPALAAPPNPGPSVLAPSAGGVSTGQTLPPVPGFLQSPPLASAPAPKESDLRNGGALLAESLGMQPVTLVGLVPPSPQDAPPYYLALAGLPPSAPGSAERAVVPISSPGSVPLASPGSLPASNPGSLPSSESAAGPSSRASHGATAPAIPSSASSLESRARVPDTRSALNRFQPELIAHGTEPVPRLPNTRGQFDPYAVKRDFPILAERVNGKPLVWLDNAATTQKPKAVIDRLSYYYEHENSNIHRAAHTLAARASDAYEAAREKVKTFINARSVNDVIFVRGATEGINLVAQSWGRRNVYAGDEIVISWLEHHANIVPWQQLCAEKGAKLRVAPVDARGQVILEEYEKLLGPRTKLVAITQVSNALGSILPATEMTELAHRHGACVLIDGAQAVSHLRADVQALDADFYVFSGHKVFAPTGIGVVYGKSALLAAMPPWQGGGNMIQDVTFEKTSYQPAPNRFEAGTGNIADAVGLGAALDYLSSLGIENIARYEHELLEYATEHLLRVPGLTLIGTAAEKAGVLSFVLDGQRTEDMSAALNEEGIAVRSGHHCAQPILRRFGVESTVRASLAPYNTRDDIDALVSALRRLQAGHAGVKRP